MSRLNKIWQIGLVGLTLANIAYLSHNFVSWFVTLGFFLLVPGYLLLRLITDEIKAHWEVLSFSLGLSILIMILGGLALNSLHPFGLQRPLTTLNIFAMLDVITLVLLAKNKDLAFSLPHRLSAPSKEQTTMFLALTLLPFIAIGGAFRLNNGASNILTMILFALIAILFAILTWRKNLQPLYPYAIIMMGLSVLFSISMRGFNLTGHDIQTEYYVFQLTFQHQHWSMSAYRNPYNACMGITILPTIIAKITSISGIYVYKVITQLIFALALVPAYFFTKRLSNARVALVGAFAFISLPTFINEMPFLNRQEVAFLFFALLMLVTFIKIQRRPKTILTILILIGLILSHYSSSYVTLGIVALAWIFYKIILKLNHTRDRSPGLPLLSIPVIIVMLLFTFLWNTQITTTTGGLKQTITQSLQGIIDHSSSQATDVSYSILAPSIQSPPELLAKYAGNSISQVQYIPEPNLPLTKLGRSTSHIINAESLNNILRFFAAKILQILMLIGIITLFLRQRKNATKQESYFLALACACVLLLVLQTLLPQLSVDYGTQRFFQQAMVILALPTVLAAEFLTRFAKRIKAYVVILFFAILFLDLSGFIPQILGEYPAQLSLNNLGTNYDNYYIHNSELYAAQWLLLYRKPNLPVDMDKYSKLRFINIPQGRQLAPKAIIDYAPGSYIYENYGNVHTGIYHVLLSGTIVTYRLTVNLNDRQDLIYTNADSNILK